MTLDSIFLILRRQFIHKWGRFLLASGGIMIGIWAITLTSSISLGLSDTIIKAINSQTFAKEISIWETSDKKTDFLQISSAPTFIPFGEEKTKKLQEKYPNIVDTSRITSMNFYYHLPQADNQTKCVEDAKKFTTLPSNVPSELTQSLPQAAPGGKEKFEKSCLNFRIDSNSFIRFYETNRTLWLGKNTEPAENEVVWCFKCGSNLFYEKLGVNEPKDLLNTEINVELQRGPELYEIGKPLDVSNFSRTKTNIDKSEIKKLKIVAVVDDRESNFLSGGIPIYFHKNYYTEAFKKANPDLDLNNYSALDNIVYINSYDNLDTTIAQLKSEGFLTFSLAQSIISSIKVAFNVLSIILASFGFIALIASVFGIVNVMTISVLERKKEIGILKSLGAKNSDIFSIFLLESMSLGIIGWTLGTLLAMFFGYIISLIFKLVLQSDRNWEKSLGALNISEFSPSFPWWLLLATLVVAVFFTTISGIFPAVSAGRQNPVDVLRGE